MVSSSGRNGVVRVAVDLVQHNLVHVLRTIYTRDALVYINKQIQTRISHI